MSWILWRGEKKKKNPKKIKWIWVVVKWERGCRRRAQTLLGSPVMRSPTSFRRVSGCWLWMMTPLASRSWRRCLGLASMKVSNLSVLSYTQLFGHQVLFFLQFGLNLWWFFLLVFNLCNWFCLGNWKVQVFLLSFSNFWWECLRGFGNPRFGFE